jgi:phosphate transport system protein
MSFDETRTDFHRLMDEVRTDLIHMGAHVIEGISAVTSALLTGDVAASDQQVSADDELDLLSIEGEEKVIRLLALQQPVASDLRFLITDLKMIGEIERSGDLVTNIAKAVPRLQGVDLSPRLRGLIEQMREQAERLYSLAMSSYADRDGGLASALGDLDDQLDELHNLFVDAVFVCRSEHTLTTQQAVQLAVIGRFYERIGDHAVNIGQRVHYLVTGELPEHAGAARARARREAESAE